MQAIDTKAESTAGMKLPHLITPLPGPKAKQIVERDSEVVSPSYTRDYPLVAKRGRGAVIEDVDGNKFLDFAAGIACGIARAVRESAQPRQSVAPTPPWRGRVGRAS